MNLSVTECNKSVTNHNRVRQNAMHVDCRVRHFATDCDECNKILSRLVLFCPGLSHFVPFCPSVSYFFPLCPNLSRYVRYCPTLVPVCPFPALSCFVLMSCFIMLCPALFHFGPSFPTLSRFGPLCSALSRFLHFVQHFPALLV
jgi:hypothetical protein